MFFSVLVAAGMLWPSTNPLWSTYTDPVVFEFLLGATICRAFKIPAS